MSRKAFVKCARCHSKNPAGNRVCEICRHPLR